MLKRLTIDEKTDSSSIDKEAAAWTTTLMKTIITHTARNENCY